MNEQRNPKRFVVVGTQSWGLYYGETDATDEQIAESESIRLDNCRHIFRWRGWTGGITSLAAHGPCGPRIREARIGAPAPSALITGVRNVYDCSAEAVANFALVEAHAG
jgi:hypothetical protein